MDRRTTYQHRNRQRQNWRSHLGESEFNPHPLLPRSFVQAMNLLVLCHLGLGIGQSIPYVHYCIYRMASPRLKLRPVCSAGRAGRASVQPPGSHSWLTRVVKCRREFSLTGWCIRDHTTNTALTDLFDDKENNSIT